MSIRNYNFNYLDQKIRDMSPDFGKTVPLNEMADLMGDAPSLYPEKWINFWKEKSVHTDPQDPNKGAGGYSLSGDIYKKMSSINAVMDFMRFDPGRHNFSLTNLYTRDWEQIDLTMPFKSADYIPGVECRDGQLCSIAFWINYFFTWPLPVRQVRAFTDSFYYRSKRTLPGYIKGSRHIERFGTWEWNKGPDYYPLGAEFNSWNGDAPAPFLDWSYFVNTTGSQAKEIGGRKGGVYSSTDIGKGAVHNYLVSLSEGEEGVPAVQPALWDMNIDVGGGGGEWMKDSKTMNAACEKLALYVFLHTLHTTDKILSRDDYDQLVLAFRNTLSGHDTDTYATAGFEYRMDIENRIDSEYTFPDPAAVDNPANDQKIADYINDNPTVSDLDIAERLNVSVTKVKKIRKDSTGVWKRDDGGDR